MSPQPLRVLGEEVDIVEEFKYLGVSIDNRLNRKANINSVYKKGKSRLFFLRMLLLLEMFYQCVVASALHFAIVCWCSREQEANLSNYC